MHIPDNYLSPSTCAVFGMVMIPIWKRTISKLKKEINKKKIPMLGVCAAFSFLIMMFNIPLPWGTTGHAVGATLVAILIGPYAACISITIALSIQAIFFGDGGILAFGVNSFNMAFIMPFIGYYIYTFLISRFKGSKAELISAGIASYIGIVIASIFAGIEFGVQPLLFKDTSGAPLYCPYGLKIAIPAMVIPHMFVAGVLEAIITVGVYAYVKKMSPGAIYDNTKIKISPIYALIIVLVLLSPLGLIANGTAWGEWNANELKNAVGYIPKGMERGLNFNAVMKGYSLLGISEIKGYVISALVGVLIILIIFKLITLSNKKVNNKWK
jgi:cobalt/nickel transport system permease protein